MVKRGDGLGEFLLGFVFYIWVFSIVGRMRKSCGYFYLLSIFCEGRGVYMDCIRIR